MSVLLAAEHRSCRSTTRCRNSFRNGSTVTITSPSAICSTTRADCVTRSRCSAGPLRVKAPESERSDRQNTRAPARPQFRARHKIRVQQRRLQPARDHPQARHRPVVAGVRRRQHLQAAGHDAIAFSRRSHDGRAESARLVTHETIDGWRAGQGRSGIIGNAGMQSTVGDLLRWSQNFDDARVGSPAISPRCRSRQSSRMARQGGGHGLSPRTISRSRNREKPREGSRNRDEVMRLPISDSPLPCCATRTTSSWAAWRGSTRMYSRTASLTSIWRRPSLQLKQVPPQRRRR